MVRIKKRIIIVTIPFAFAIMLLLYPFFANIYNNKVQEILYSGYSESIADTDPEILKEMYELAQEYNAAMLTGGTSEYDYDSLLNLNGDGIMATISIPSIDVYLSIYHGTSESVLQKGVGHFESSSLPVGGTSTHAVLTAHTGIIGSSLFTELDKLEIGDVFYIYVLGETLAYEVTEIETVLPSDVDSLTVRRGEDLVTLVTCTPYGINTHRLLVTGSRIDYIEEETETEVSVDWFSLDYILLYVAGLEVIVYILLIAYLKKKEKRS